MMVIKHFPALEILEQLLKNSLRILKKYSRSLKASLRILEKS